MPFIVRAIILSLALFAGIGCSERPLEPLQWSDGKRVVRVDLARDRLRVMGVGDANAVRRILPDASEVVIEGDAAVVSFAEVDDGGLAERARRLAPLGEVQAAVVGDDTGWLGHRVTVALGGRDAAAVAARHGLTLVDRPSYAPDHAIFACDPSSLTSAVAVARSLVDAGDVDEAVPAIHRQPRPRSR